MRAAPFLSNERYHIELVSLYLHTNVRTNIPVLKQREEMQKRSRRWNQSDIGGHRVKAMGSAIGGKENSAKFPPRISNMAP